MVLRVDIIQDMADIENTDTEAFNRLLFEMTTSVAHEIAHFLVGSITGQALATTPRKLRVTPGASKGEPGYYLEKGLLAGVPDFFPNGPPSNRRGGTVAGNAWIFQGPNPQDLGVPISYDVIRRFVRNGKSGLPTSSESVSPDMHIVGGYPLPLVSADIYQGGRARSHREVMAKAGGASTIDLRRQNLLAPTRDRNRYLLPSSGAHAGPSFHASLDRHRLQSPPILLESTSDFEDSGTLPSLWLEWVAIR
ncbi:hypothetical protein F5Y17DRAFT_130276 [Xylariaceae sp. FL0594]|nr:hypothetical protein F5Y17DRAFT_130276 [Xylariaceae sp. FL0594]